MSDIDITETPHGQKLRMPNGDILTMNRDYPRPAFDVTNKHGVYQGYLYPYHVAEEYPSGTLADAADARHAL